MSMQYDASVLPVSAYRYQDALQYYGMTDKQLDRTVSDQSSTELLELLLKSIVFVVVSSFLLLLPGLMVSP